jgi:phospholipase C
MPASSALVNMRPPRTGGCTPVDALDSSKGIAMTSEDRRNFLKLGAGTLAAAGVASVLPPGIRKALAQITQPTTLADLDHIIILMQENRSFDHYFGMLPGVRGFADAHPAPLPSGKTVWYQPNHADGSHAATNPAGVKVASVMPYALNPRSTPVDYQSVNLDHSWRGPLQQWQHWDGWVQKKGFRTMGYLQPADLPFYYALANAFTICDAYHCSLFGPTNPNRRFMWTGTSGGGTITNPAWKHYMVQNDGHWESSEISDIANDSGGQNGWDWRTYADVLEDNRVSWKIYQGYRNFGDNELAYFNAYRRGGDASKIAKARSYAGKLGDDDDQSADALIAALKAELQGKDASGRNTFPAVSWIVAPASHSEHPAAGNSSVGEVFTERVINAVIGSKDVWDKCAIFVTYDENDGYFDHVAAPLPPLDGYGKHNLTKPDGSPIDLADETYDAEPIGMGPRVPMLVVSPWSKGGRVSSRLSDHTSIIRFLETWLVAKGHRESDVRCANISAWRRAICGDLTETLNLVAPINTPSDRDVSQWKITEPKNGPDAQYAPYPHADGDTFSPGVAAGQRIACALPYDYQLQITRMDRRVELVFDNSQSTAAATFIVYLNALTTAQQVFHYSVAAGSKLQESLELHSGQDQGQVFGPQSPRGYAWTF